MPDLGNQLPDLGNQLPEVELPRFCLELEGDSFLKYSTKKDLNQIRRCQKGYYGDALSLLGCTKCPCNNNLDMSIDVPCDQNTGECKQ